MSATPAKRFLSPTTPAVGGILLAMTMSAAAGNRQRVQDELHAAWADGQNGNPPASVVSFPPGQARFIRLVVHRTHGATAVGIDELEIHGPEGNDNLALASRGAIARASSLISDHAAHAVAHLNDGKFGNDHSWIPASTGEEWAEIELPVPAVVDRVVFARDRTGRFTDRQACEVEVRLSLDGSAWTTAARATPPANPQRLAGLRLPASAVADPSWRGMLEYAFLRERDTWGRLEARDYLSPLVHDRPAVPGGPPYWGRLARLAPLERVLVLFEEMIDRLAEQGLAVDAERGELAGLRRRAAVDGGSDALYLDARHTKRRLFLRDPRLAPAERVLFAKRHPLHPSHNYSDHMDSWFVAGGGVCVLQVPRDADGRLDPARAEVETLFDGSNGIVRHPVADHAAQTIYFAYRPDQPRVAGWETYWHLWAMRPDGAEARPLTEGPYTDFDPVPLPDGDLGFISTRCASRFLCWEPQAYVLYRMKPDGTAMRRLSWANVSEWDPTVMRDGRILWTRSEYQDKGADFGHTLWAIRPDGTHPELVFGNNTPYGFGHAREVPGSHELVCTIMSHGDHQGPIALLDPSGGPYATAGIVSITPDTRPQYQMDRSHHETFRHPEPVSRDHFLVSHSPGPRAHWGLYLIDRYGNRELLYMDPAISSKRPSPLRPRPQPPVLPETRDAGLAAQGLGQFTVQDVYEGLGPAVPRGMVKYLQVSQEVPPPLEPLPCGQFRSTHPAFQDFYATPIHRVHGPPDRWPTRTDNALQPHAFRAGSGRRTDHGVVEVTENTGWPSYVAKAVLGTVPVAEDGSANFTAPAERVLYFHLLDDNFDEIQRMRSVIQLQAGERRSCVGCHENRLLTTVPRMTLALAGPAQALEPPPWGAVPFDYGRVVQPVLNARCVACHDGADGPQPDLRATLDPHRVPASYRSLVAGGWVHYFDWFYGARHFKAEPLGFGTRHSRLFEALATEAHQDVTLEVGELRALKAWIDLNCPLWPDYRYRPERPAAAPEEVAGGNR